MNTLKQKYTVKDFYTLENTDFETFDEAIDFCHEHEIIYYHKALDYLMENDASLAESLGLAYEHCIELKDTNSEMLATLHYQNKLIDSIIEL